MQDRAQLIQRVINKVRLPKATLDEACQALNDPDQIQPEF